MESRNTRIQRRNPSPIELVASFHFNVVIHQRSSNKSVLTRIVQRFCRKHHCCRVAARLSLLCLVLATLPIYSQSSGSYRCFVCHAPAVRNQNTVFNDVTKFLPAVLFCHEKPKIVLMKVHRKTCESGFRFLFI